MAKINYEIKVERAYSGPIERVEDLFAADDLDNIGLHKAEEIKRRIGAWDEWAWCYVDVVATCGPSDCVTSIGPCSFDSLEDFAKSYEYKNMQRDARKFLIEDLKEAAAAYEYLLTLKD